MTETTGAATYLPNQAHDPAKGKLRSCGVPWPGVDVKIVGADGGETPRGAIGEIVVKSPVVMKGYWNKPESTAHSVNDGWMRTGDAAYMDEDGYIFIYDRVKDTIVTGGENVYPAEVENAIFGHPDVADVAVIGVPDDKWGEAVKAVVVAKPDGAARCGRHHRLGARADRPLQSPEVGRFRRSDPAQHHRQDPAPRIAQALLGGPRPHGWLRRRASRRPGILAKQKLRQTASPAPPVQEEHTMARRLVDISAPLQNDVAADPPGLGPRIEYIDHQQSLPQILLFFPGLKKEELPDGQGWAVETVQLTTHNGAHLDAPWHYHPTMNEGERAWTIDEVPLEWCFQRGVKLDFRHFADGYVATAADVEAELERIGHTLQAPRHRRRQHQRRREVRPSRLCRLRLRHGRRGDALPARPRRPPDRHRRMELGRPFRPYRPALCRIT